MKVNKIIQKLMSLSQTDVKVEFLIENFEKQLSDLKRKAGVLIPIAEDWVGFLKRFAFVFRGKLSFRIEIGSPFPVVPEWVHEQLDSYTIEELFYSMLRSLYNSLCKKWGKIYFWADKFLFHEEYKTYFIIITLFEPYDEIFKKLSKRLPKRIEDAEQFLVRFKREFEGIEVKELEKELDYMVKQIKWDLEEIETCSKELEPVKTDLPQMKKEALDLRKRIEDIFRMDSFWKEKIKWLKLE